MSDRKSELYALGKELLSDRFLQTITGLHGEPQKNFDEHITEFQRVCGKLFGRAAKLQVQGNWGNISAFCICPLQSSLRTGSYSVQLTLYDENMYFGQAGITEYWIPRFLYRHLEEDLEYFSPLVKQKLVRAMDYEIRDYGLEYAANYQALLNRFCAANTEAVLTAPGFQEMDRADDFKILFGAFMNPMFQIYPKYEEETV